MWFKIDDRLQTHPKARRAGLAAMGLWTLAGAHSMCYLTDGFVEEWFVEGMPDGPALAARLVDAGLWEIVPGGWQFHDWEDYQPTREEVQADRESAAERKRRWKEKRDAERAQNDDGTRSATRGGTEPERVGNTAPNPNPNPNPNPDTPNGVSVGREPRKRGTRLPEPFIVTLEMREWASQEVPTVDVDASTRRFVDYWRAKAGKDATKLDWLATWRNWLRRDADSAGRTNRAQERIAGNLSVVAQLAAMDAADQMGIAR